MHSGAFPWFSPAAPGFSCSLVFFSFLTSESDFADFVCYVRAEGEGAFVYFLFFYFLEGVQFKF